MRNLPERVRSHTCFFSLSFLHPLRHRYQAGILGAANRAEMADVEQMKKIVPLVTCGITIGQNVCELMFGVNVSNFNFRIKIIPVKQPIQSNSVGSLDTCLIVGLRPYIIILITASWSSKTYNMALETECVSPDGTRSILVRSRLVCMFGVCFCTFGCVIADKFPRGSLSSLVLVIWFGEVESKNPIHA